MIYQDMKTHIFTAKKKTINHGRRIESIIV